MKQICVVVCLLLAFCSRVSTELQLSEDSKCPHPFKTYLGGIMEGNAFVELFRTCYDQANVSAKYTMHTLQPPFTVTNSNPLKNPSWSTNRIITAKAAASFSNANIRSRTHATFPQYDRGHLTPSADFSKPSHRQATYTYVNAVPQLSALNSGKWKSLEYFVRSLAELDENRVTVVTGVLGVLNVNSQPVYLYGHNGNPIPEFVYKIVHLQRLQGGPTELYTFLAYNYIDEPHNVEALCDILDCPKSLNGGGIYCCNATTFIHKNAATFAEFFNVRDKPKELPPKGTATTTSIWTGLMGNLRDLFSVKRREKND